MNVTHIVLFRGCAGYIAGVLAVLGILAAWVALGDLVSGCRHLLARRYEITLTVRMRRRMPPAPCVLCEAAPCSCPDFGTPAYYAALEAARHGGTP